MVGDDIEVEYLTCRVANQRKTNGVKMHYAKITFTLIEDGIRQTIMTQPWMSERSAQEDTKRIINILKTLQHVEVSS